MQKLISYDQLVSTCILIIARLKNEKYAIRGTASLVLQKFDFKVEDIDIICDENCSNKINNIFKEYIIKPVKFSESPKYKSFFGELNIDGVKIEIMGNYQIKTKKGWSEIYNAEENQLTCVSIDNFSIPCTSVSTEMKMYLEMGRFKVFHKLKSQVENFSNPRLFA